jgi:hypothetical protein
MKANIKLGDVFMDHFGLDPRRRQTARLQPQIIQPAPQEQRFEPELPPPQESRHEIVAVNVPPEPVMQKEENPQKYRDDEYIDSLQDEITSYMIKYENLKRLQNDVLEHLEDARASHLEREVEVLNAKIPQRQLMYNYNCENDRKELAACYRQHLNLKNRPTLHDVDILKCRPSLLKFTECANQNKRQFLNNPNLI